MNKLKTWRKWKSNDINGTTEEFSWDKIRTRIMDVFWSMLFSDIFNFGEYRGKTRRLKSYCHKSDICDSVSNTVISGDRDNDTTWRVTDTVVRRQPVPKSNFDHCTAHWTTTVTAVLPLTAGQWAGQSWGLFKQKKKIRLMWMSYHQQAWVSKWYYWTQ